MEGINYNQMAFLSFQYVLDNLLLAQETLDWTRHSNQSLVFYKLNFAKAYDKDKFKKFVYGNGQVGQGKYFFW
jgi:hypothetical protein